MDTGAEISVLPVDKNSKIKPSNFYLYAANNTKIQTYGRKILKLDLGLRRQFTWQFVIAKISKPIIRADFLKKIRFVS